MRIAACECEAGGQQHQVLDNELAFDRQQQRVALLERKVRLGDQDRERAQQMHEPSPVEEGARVRRAGTRDRAGTTAPSRRRLRGWLDCHVWRRVVPAPLLTEAFRSPPFG